ncbi:uncharacterized protein LOC133194859 [Saccostrea echinata]|uniref:uncharacterized protein LOC133194859 n=1 Tax=Saccostrea echinata TaxID=191078 RepID=UPI002A80C22B|nr:uncharacterized protein LOC133194859 [Saccostrea echinata]
MNTLKTLRFGFVMYTVSCLCFFQISFTRKDIKIGARERLCSEDVLALLHYLQATPCQAANETHIILRNSIEDLGKCLISCEVTVSKKIIEVPLCVEQNECPIAFQSTMDDHQIDVFKEFKFCCTGSKSFNQIRVQGKCNYTLYKMENLQLGERCISDMQCKHSNMRCLKSRCSCRTGYIEYNGGCISDGDLEHLMIQKNILQYDQECEENFQCSFYGGVCSRTCSCISGYVYSGSNCIEVKQLGDTCDSEDQCYQTDYPMVCLRNRCSCTDEFLEIDKKCIRDDIALQIDDKCNSEIQCERTEKSLTCLNGKCTCKKDYTRLQNVCLKAGLKLQIPCRISLQCTGTSNATVCYEGKCVCDFGFVPVENNCKRIDKEPKELESMANKADKDNNVTASAVGAGISCLIIGVLIGLLIMFLIQRKRSSQNERNKSPKSGDGQEVYEPRMQSGSASKRETYDHLNNVKKENAKFNNTNKGCSMYCVIEPRTDPKDDTANKPSEDVGVYNHLFEKNDEGETGNYDNPETVRAAQQEVKLSRDHSENDRFLSDAIRISNHKDQDESKENNDEDNYFVLEKECNQVI